MQKFPAKILHNSAAYTEISGFAARHQTPVAVTGVGAVQKAAICYALSQQFQKKALFVVPDDEDSAKMALNLRFFFGDAVKELPAKGTNLLNSESHSMEAENRRAGVLSEVLAGNVSVLVAPADALIQYTARAERLKAGTFSLCAGGEMPLDTLLSRLASAGYARSEQVEGRGQFACRGGIVDIFPAGSEYPVRLEYWGDTVDAMGIFDPMTQRRIENIDRVSVTPASETAGGDEMKGALSEGIAELIKKQQRRREPNAKLLSALRADLERVETGTFQTYDKYIPLLRDFLSEVFDYIPSDTLVFFSEEAHTADRLRSLYKLQNEDLKSAVLEGMLAPEMAEMTLSFGQLYARLQKYDVVSFDSLPHTFYELAPKALISVTAKQLPPFAAQGGFLIEDIQSYQKQGYQIAVVARSKGRAQDIAEQLLENHIKAEAVDGIGISGTVQITEGHLSGGLELTDAKFVLLCEGERKGGAVHRKKHKGTGEKIRTFADLSVGDLVVHDTYGIGQYLGIEALTVDKITKDYIKIRYKGTDTLYIPATQLDVLSKYIGSQDKEKVKLSKMGGVEWQNTKARVKKAVADMADDLIRLYSERASVQGYAFSPDGEWQHDFEEKFEFEETDDQLKSIEEIKVDMEKPYPMDRLLCGDVGFGKTEVALRAAFKCVADGKQAAILVPTTILAWQHYQTIQQRFTGFPISCELLSRFRSKSQQQESIRKIRRGEADIVVGTHRLIQKDVVFKNLGLVVVDEEQRFGVAHKERLKEMTKSVDVLTLTATPIPRTLNMALTGIRDMSVLEEAPQDRHPVATYVMEYDFDLVAEAVRQELRRGGQVFYLYNRIENIDRVAARLSAVLPGKQVEFAHGQMDEETLSDIWGRVVGGETDVLVCTTIIESGIDVPNANTLIVEDADKLGLAQLYQLRGRVGRSFRRASCYLTYRRGKALSEDAEKRLTAIREFTEFGSGFKIAMRDLEIRGAGNLLGASQHGHMESVGYDLYVKLLEEAVREKNGEEAAPKIECNVDLQASAYIPKNYVQSSELRVDMYKKIAAIENAADYDDMIDEFCDRFGEPPAVIQTLCRVALVKNMASALGIRQISQKDTRAVIDASGMGFEPIAKLSDAFKGRLLYNAGTEPFVTLTPPKNAVLLDEVMRFLDQYARIKEEEKHVQ